MNEIHINLTPAQSRKALKGLTFQLSSEQLQAEPNSTIDLFKKSDVSRLNRNKRNGKGFRFQNGSYSMSNVVDGGKLNFKKVFNNAKRSVQNRANQEVNKAINQAKSYAQQEGQNLLNQGKQFAKQKANEYANLGLEQLNQTMGTGIRPRKGTQEAKDKMAALRAMRKNKKSVSSTTGGKLNFGKAFKNVTRAASNAAKNYAKDEGKNLLKRASRGAVNVGIEGLKSVANYAVPGSDIFLEPQFNKLERKANSQLDRRIDGLGINDTYIAHNNPASTAQIQLRKPNKSGSRLKGDQSIRGDGFLGYGFRQY